MSSLALKVRDSTSLWKFSQQLEIILRGKCTKRRKNGKDRSSFATSFKSALALEEKRKNIHIIGTEKKKENKHEPESAIVKHKSLESLECGYVQHLKIYTGKWDSEHPKRTSINVEEVTRYDYNRITRELLLHTESIINKAP